MHWPAIVILTALIAPGAHAAPPPWQRSETRQPCGTFDLFRTPYFGDLHIHTRFSADAYIFGTRVLPRDAYAFARGATIPFSDDNEAQTRSAHIDRPLDFAAVTDHSEWYGEVKLCDTPGSPVYDINLCQLLRQFELPDDRFPVTVNWLYPAGVYPTTHLPQICGTPGVDCGAASASVWREIQAAAEEAYDRTSACTFTSLLGYEYTASPLGRHVHRNIIFRNDRVPSTVASYVDTADGGIPQGVWTAIENTCLNAATGCDAVIIPHNPNLSGGLAWPDPADAAEALRRQTIEPLVEIHQIKGNSECRFDRLAQAGAGTADELCTFEQQRVSHQGPDATELPIDQYPLRNMVRNTLKDGLALEDKLGVNPFRLGFVGSTDNHDGAAGSAAEVGWAGYQGNEDSSPARQLSLIRSNPGGLAVAWAEENSRDAIFAALKRRETYATSGTRPVVRFFAGDLTHVLCGKPDFVRDAYASGTPMGGELGPVRGEQSPRFAVWAAKDPGTAEAPGTDLQRIQIVKGWVDAGGTTHERVFDVAGDPHNGAGVNLATCAPRGHGFRELCAVWRDPTFRRHERAFYYARVLDNPTCRWSTRVCKAGGVDPFSPRCAAQAAAAGPTWANCCLGPDNDPFLDPLIQERAWTSPIWYRPESIARVRAEVRYGAQPGTDRFRLRLVLGRVPKGFDPTRENLSLRVSDDDDILGVTFPAGRFVPAHGGRFVLEGAVGSVADAALVVRKHEVELQLATGPTDLSHADPVDHMVTIALAAGTYRATHTRLWVLRGGRLIPGGG